MNFRCAAPSIARVAVAALSLWAAHALACDYPDRTLAQRVQSSRDVFIGEVQSTQEIDTVSFRVIERFKGPPQALVDVVSEHSDCDTFPIPSLAVPGTRYLVFTDESAGRILSNLSSRTARVEASGADIDALRRQRRAP